MNPFKGCRCGLAIGHKAALIPRSPLQSARAFLLHTRPQHFLLRIREGQTHKPRLCTQYSCDRPISKYPERSGSLEPENLVFTPRQLLPAGLPSRVWKSVLQAAHHTCLPLFGLTACLTRSWIHTPRAKNYQHARTHTTILRTVLCLADYRRMRGCYSHVESSSLLWKFITLILG